MAWWSDNNKKRSKIAVSRCVVNKGDELAGVYDGVDGVGVEGEEGLYVYGVLWYVGVLVDVLEGKGSEVYGYLILREYSGRYVDRRTCMHAT